MQTNIEMHSDTFARNRGRQETEPRRGNVTPLLVSPLSNLQLGVRTRPKIGNSSRRRIPLVAANDSWEEGRPNVRLSNKVTGLTEGFKKICQRWGLDNLAMARLLHLEEETALSGQILSGQRPPLTGDLKDRMTIVIGISLGLGELFGDNREAEFQWLSTKRSKLDDSTPLEHMLKGAFTNLTDIAGLLDNARGLR